MMKIAMYAGHGGSDPGAVSNGLQEKNLTVAVSNQATSYLRAAGYTVMNDRTTDIDSTIANKVQMANSSNVDAVVEIHFNTNSGAPGTGTEVYYSISGGKGKELATAILNKIVALGYKSRGIKTKVQNGKDYFGIIRETNAPAVLVECAFINNSSDMKLYSADRMGKAVAEGIMEIFGGSIPKDDTGGSANNGNGGTPTAPPAPDTLYRVQTGAYQKQSNAEKQAEKLKEEGFDTYIVAPASASKSIPSIQVGSKVKVRPGAKTYEGKELASFVYTSTYNVLELSGDRAVIGQGSTITAAVMLSDLILQ